VSAPPSERTAARLAASAIEAINSREPARLGKLLDSDVEIVTGRSVHRGVDAATAWAGKEYDHLVRRYSIDEYRCRSGAALALGSVEYVWSEGGEVADSSPIAIELEFRGDGLRVLRVHDDTAAALADFDA